MAGNPKRVEQIRKTAEKLARPDGPGITYGDLVTDLGMSYSSAHRWLARLRRELDMECVGFKITQFGPPAKVWRRRKGKQHGT